MAGNHFYSHSFRSLTPLKISTTLMFELCLLVNSTHLIWPSCCLAQPPHHPGTQKPSCQIHTISGPRGASRKHHASTPCALFPVSGLLDTSPSLLPTTSSQAAKSQELKRPPFPTCFFKSSHQSLLSPLATRDSLTSHPALGQHLCFPLVLHSLRWFFLSHTWWFFFFLTYWTITEVH